MYSISYFKTASWC